jgi:hypothetical protein
MYLAPKGYSVVTDGWGNETRRDTYTCRHCSHVCEVEPGHSHTEHFCRTCYAPICAPCTNKPCDVYERKMDRIEATAAWLQERFGEKYLRAIDQPRREAAAIEVALRRQQMLKDMGF